MINHYQEIIQHLINSQSKKDALISLFEMIKVTIPLEKIFCYRIKRSTKLVTIFIEYSLDDYISDFSYHIERLGPIEKIKYYRDNPDIIVIQNKNEAPEEFILVSQLHFNTLSYMGFLFQISENLNSYMFFGCFSSKLNIFTEEHREFLRVLLPFIKQLLVDNYHNNPEPQKFLASNKVFPTSYNAQLSSCPDLAKVLKQVNLVAPYDVTTLITGPTGAGKELVATTVHLLSKRSNDPFIDVNCAAIPETLLESELFGFEKGAFTGAVQTKKGYFEQADKGTIFLDEIGELTEFAQASLLRALETKQVRRIGSEKTISLDVRIIAATNKNLLELVKQGKFREDLYYRIKGFHISIPPLSMRRQDIKFLIEYFYSLTIDKYQLENPPAISTKTALRLINYAWPGNVRQLKYAIEEAMFKAMSEEKNELYFDFLDEKITKKEKLTQEEIEEALREAEGKVEGKNGAAQILNIHPSTLRSRMNILGIDYKKRK